MFLAVGSLMHQLLTFDATPSQRFNTTLLILGTVIPVSIYHCWADEITVHQLTFGAMIFITGRRIRQLIREKVPNEESRKRLKSMANFGSGKSCSLVTNFYS
jgi:dihydroceramidase